MKSVRDAITDYLALRRSLGFKLRNTAGRLMEFASFLEQKGAPYITTALALKWAMQHAEHQPSYLGPALGLRSRVRSPLERERSPHRDSADRFTSVSSTANPALSLHRRGDSKAAGCRQTPLTLQRASTLDLSLLIRVVGSQWTAHQRGHQVGAQRCGSQQRAAHHPPNQVQQEPVGSASRFYSRCLGRIRPASRSVPANSELTLLSAQRS